MVCAAAILLLSKPAGAMAVGFDESASADALPADFAPQPTSITIAPTAITLVNM
jgi:hypothetical protein